MDVDVRLELISGELRSERAPANMIEVSGWHGDFVTDIEFPSNPRDFVPHRDTGGMNLWPLWGMWYHADGESGEGPPELVQDMHGIWQELMVEPDDERRVELGKGILAIQAEQLWSIGTVGKTPYPLIVNKDLRNFFDEGYWVWGLWWSSGSDPEQLFFDR